MKNHLPKKLSGFSLIEILVVLMIIGLLTAVVAINVLPSQDRARADKALADIRIYEQALELYRLDMFSYPQAMRDYRLSLKPPLTIDLKIDIDKEGTSESWNWIHGVTTINIKGRETMDLLIYIPLAQMANRVVRAWIKI